MSDFDIHRTNKQFGINPELLQSMFDLAPKNSFGKCNITYQECERRFGKANYAICSVELEGLTIGDEARAIYVEYIVGNLNEDELSSALLGLNGIEP